MELRTYLNFSQVMVASLALIFSHTGYQWMTTSNRHLAASQKDKVLNLCLVKVFQAIVSSHSNLLGLEKQVFRMNYLKIWGLLKQETYLML